MKKVAQSDKVIELELVAIVANMGRNNPIHPTKATLGESLLHGYIHNSIGFLIYNTILEVEVK